MLVIYILNSLVQFGKDDLFKYEQLTDRGQNDQYDQL